MPFVAPEHLVATQEDVDVLEAKTQSKIDAFVRYCENRIVELKEQIQMTQQAPISLPTPAQPPSNGAAPAGASQYSGPQPGIYEMQAVDAELGFTAGSAEAAPAPQVAILFEFVDGPFKGTSLTWYGFFTDKTKQGTIRALRTAGWTGNDLSDLSTVRGRAPCVIQIENDLEGKPQARIRFVGGGAIAMKNIMSDEQKKAFAASMMGFAASIVAPTAKEAAPASNGGPASVPGALGPTGQKFF